MIVCGVDIKGTEAILAIAEVSSKGEISHVECPTKRFPLRDERSSESLREFLDGLTVFARDHAIEFYCIKSRQKTGNVAAGGVTFKIEGLFQIQEICPCEFVSPQAISKVSKTNQGGLPSTVKLFQKDAYLAAVKVLMGNGSN